MLTVKWTFKFQQPLPVIKDQPTKHHLAVTIEDNRPLLLEKSPLKHPHIKLAISKLPRKVHINLWTLNSTSTKEVE